MNNFSANLDEIPAGSIQISGADSKTSDLGISTQKPTLRISLGNLGNIPHSYRQLFRTPSSNAACAALDLNNAATLKAGTHPASLPQQLPRPRRRIDCLLIELCR
ncbi:hypothetical protein [Pseudomonas sp. zfem002]|uniref:hypothetical protein n=1 Tax=Pseudomonas sp. zfem002 TaxID=3078197 RepID=UPI0029278131|nr:hypothetical protein [Pseudomonas sp. zfem002]MDU9393908.1 hypothetical protein [Pseudomonas sp. zfem002]